MNEALARLAQAKGILPRYTDTTGTVRELGEDTAAALLRACGLSVDNPRQIARELARVESEYALRETPRWIVVTVGEPVSFQRLADAEWQLELEDGECLEGRGQAGFPALPLGIHKLWINSRMTVLLAAPERLALPRRSWGLMVPLWGLTGPATGGLGGYGELVQTAKAMGASGMGFLGINPIHAGFPTDLAAISPYQPSHRRRLNILHIPAGPAASRGALIDYPAEITARLSALQTEFETFEGHPDFDAYCVAEGEALQVFARHQVLSERYGPYWTDWPEAAQNPHGSGQADPVRLRFHQWAQWRAETALADAQAAAKQAGMAHGLYLDLAVGTHPAGAETWEDQHSFVRGVSLGAPPDALGPQGQVWNLAPLDPDALIDQAFQPLADTLRHQFRHGGILRIDHILGFERAFWVPDDGSPGGYVSMPRDAMLAVARIEAARAGAIVVGEDLGVVPDGLRAALGASGILGCRVAMFERDGPVFRPAESYPEAAIASFSTHDLPTWAGWRQGQDIDVWSRLGAISDVKAALTARRAEIEGFELATGSAQAQDQNQDQANPTDRLHDFLARSPACLVAVQAETLLATADQPNLPGTVDEYPNWRQRLPVAGPDLPDLPAFAETARIMARHGRG